MKKCLLFTLLCFSSASFAETDFCVDQKGILETSYGTFKFKTVEYCQMVYKNIKSCQQDNVMRAENQLPKLDCGAPLQTLIDSGSKNIERVSE